MVVEAWNSFRIYLNSQNTYETAWGVQYYVFLGRIRRTFLTDLSFYNIPIARAEKVHLQTKEVDLKSFYNTKTLQVRPNVKLGIYTWIFGL